MNEALRRRLVGAAVLAAVFLIVGILFFKRDGDSDAPTPQPSDLADVRSYAIEVPAVPEQPPQEILAENPPIGTLLQTPDQPAESGRDRKSRKSAKSTRSTDAAQPVAAAPSGPVIPVVGWSVQVGSFASRSNADGLQQRLKEKGYPAFVYRNAAENPPLFRVRVGPYQQQDEARIMAQRLREELRLDVAVVANG